MIVDDNSRGLYSETRARSRQLTEEGVTTRATAATLEVLRKDPNCSLVKDRSCSTACHLLFFFAKSLN